MFGIGSTELLVIFVVALIVLGPKSLPQIARTLGKTLSEFRKVSTEFQRTLNTEVDIEDEERKAKAEKEKEHNAPDATAQAEQPAGTGATSVTEAQKIANPNKDVA